MAFTPSDTRRFAEILAAYDKRLARLERGARSSQLSRASIENAGLPAYDADGTLRQIIGRQDDGTFAVTYTNGPAPPRPTTPVVSARQLAVVVGWDGEFEAGAARPGDFARVDVHMHTDPDFEPTGATLYGSLVGEGAVVIPADNETHYVRTVAVTLADTPSAATEAVAVTALPATQVIVEQLSADRITSGTLTADVTLASTIRTGDTGARVELSHEGLVSYDPSNEVAVVLPTDTEADASFAGSIVAGGLTVTGAASFRSTGNEISKGANLLLQAATTAPTNAPSAVVGWEVEWMTNPGTYRGLVHHDGRLWAGRLNAPEIIAQDGQTITLQPPSGTDPIHPTGGITRVGTHWYVLGRVGGTGDWYLAKHNDTGVEQARTYWGTSKIAYEQYPCLGTDGTNLLIAQFDPTASRFYLQTRDAGSLAWASATPTTSNSGFNGPAVGVARGQFDLGIDRVVVLSQNGNRYWTYRPDGTYDPDFVWPSPLMGSAGGFAWDGTRFWCVENVAAYASNRLAKHSTVKWVGWEDWTYHAALTWRNSTAGYETDAGRVGSFSMRKRAWATLTAPDIPAGGTASDPDSVGFYLSRSATPARTNLFRQALPPVGARSVTLGDTITFQGTNPPVESNFPGSNPGTITNADRSLSISGDGTIRAVSVDAALPGITGGGFGLPSNYDITSGAGNWGDWGTAHVIPNPARTVYMQLICAGFAESNDTPSWFGLRIAYSTDGGATWSYGKPVYDWIGAGVERGSFTCLARWKGTPTGDIHLKAQFHPGAIDTGTEVVRYREGDIDYLLIPTE